MSRLRRPLPLATRPCLERLEDRTLPSITLSGQPDWAPLGPAPITDAQNVIPSGTASSLAAGAIQAVAVDPAPGMAAHVLVGTVNGGIWQTNDINASPVLWSTTTDQLPSLAISDVAFSPADSHIIYAGTGSYTNGGVGTAGSAGLTNAAGSGGAALGLYRSADGGATWTVRGGDTFAGLRIVRVLPTLLDGGQTVLAATTDTNGPNTGGVYRSDDSGVTWRRLSGANGLPDAGVTDLVADPSNADRFYAAVPNGTGAGIYRLDVTGGNATWDNVSNDLPAAALQGMRIKLAVSPAGAHPVYAGVINTDGFLQGVYRGVAGGGGVISWAAVGPGGKPPNIYGNYPNAQGGNNFSIVADPTADNLVYVGGDARKPFPFAGNLARGDSAANTWTAISAQGNTPAQPGTVVPGAGDHPATTAPHADSRNMVFSGNEVLEVDDGGIYRLTNPAGAGGAPTWAPAVGNLQDAEMYLAAVDDRNNSDPSDDVVLGAEQDNDAAQRDPSGTWRAQVSGDGTLVLADSVHGFRYLATQNFYLMRSQNGGALTTPAATITGTEPGVTRTLNSAAATSNDPLIEGLPFQPAAALNMADPNRLLVGGNATLYESSNNADTFRSVGGIDNSDPSNPAPVMVPVGSGTMTGTVQYGAIAYGNLTNPNLAYAGTISGEIDFTTDITAPGGGFQATDFATVAGGATPLGIVVDPNNGLVAYAVTDTGVFQTTNGTHWTDISDNIRSVALKGGVNTLASIALADGVLLVGGYGGVFRRLPVLPGACPDSSWVEYGANLPNVVVGSLQYDARSDTLVASTYGRGAWRVAHASATLATAPILTVTGDGNANALGLRQDPLNPLRVLVSDGLGNTESFATTAFQRLDFHGLGADDTVTVSSDGTSGPAATGSVKFVNFLVTVDGGGQPGDRLVLEDRGDNGAVTVTVTSATVGAGTGDTFFGDCGRLDYAGLGGLRLDLSAAPGDVAQVESTAAGTTTELVGGPATAFTVGAGGSAQGVQGTLEVEAPAGAAKLKVDDSADPTARAVVLTSFAPSPGDSQGNSDAYGAIVGLAPAAIAYEAGDLSGLTVNGGTGGNTFDVRATPSGTTTLNGGAGADVFNVSSDAPGNGGDLAGLAGVLNIVGGAGSNALNVSEAGRSAADVVTLSAGQIASAVAPFTINYQARGDFAGGVTLTTGSGDDTVLVQGAGAAPTSIFTGGGDDTVAVTAVPSGGTVRVDGGPGSNTLVGPDADSLWTLTGANQGTLGAAVSFQDVQALTGGSSADTFVVQPGGSVDGEIDGGPGTDTLDLSAVAGGRITLTGPGASDGFDGQAQGNAPLLGGFRNIDALRAGGATLASEMPANVWHVTGRDAGDVNGLPFSGMASLVGGSGPDQFLLADGATRDGPVDGGGGDDTLDYSAYQAAVTVNLQTGQATGLGGFTNIRHLRGGAGSDTLMGPDAGATWDLTGDGAGAVGGFTFTSVEDLRGGAGDDVFQVGEGVSESAPIDGGGGRNAVQTAQDADFTLTDTSLSSTHGTSLTFANIQVANLLGGGGDNTFTVSGWTGTGSLNGQGGRDVVVAAKDADFNLSDGRLTSSDGMSLALSGIAVADLSGGPSSNTFTVGGWTGGGSLDGQGGKDTVVAVKDVDFTLADAALTASDGMDLTLSGIAVAELSGGPSGHTFTVGGWTGGGSLDGQGGKDTVEAAKDADFTLSDTALTASDGLSLSLSGIAVAALSGGPDGNTFTVSGWTGGGSLDGQGSAAVVAAKGADFTLADGALTASDGMGLSLSGIAVADLIGGAGTTFTVSGWTGGGTLAGAGHASVVAAKDADLTLSDSSLTASDGMGLTLSGIVVAELSGGPDGNTFTVSGWTGTGSLDGQGGTDVVVAAKDVSSVTLEDTSLSASDGLGLSLASIEAARLVGGPSANSFAVGAWTGTCSLDGAGGADTYAVGFNGSGQGLVGIGDSGADPGDRAVVYGTPGDDALAVSADRVARGTEVVFIYGVQQRFVFGGEGDDTFFVPLSSAAPLQVALDGGPGSDVVGVVDLSPGAALINTPVGPGAGIIRSSYLSGAPSVVTYGQMEGAFTAPGAGASFVELLYRQALSRDATPAELAFWGPVAEAGDQLAVAQAVLRSAEGRELLVTDWFRLYLGRSPVGGEEQPYVAALLAGATEEQALASLLGSAGFYAQVGGSDDAFVGAVSSLLLGRAPTPVEQLVWLESLQLRLGRAGLAALILTGPEYRGLFVRGLYSSVLGRQPTQVEVDGWLNSGLDLTDLRAALLAASEFPGQMG